MIFDIIIIAIFTVAIMICFKKGFALSFFGTASSVLSIVLVSIFHNPISEFIKKSELGKSFYDDIYSGFYDKYVTSTNELTNIDTLPKFLTDSINNSIEATAEVIDYISQRTFDIIIFIVSFIIILLLVKLIIKISPKIIKVLTKLPVIKQIDKLLGICFGIISGCIWTLLFVNVMSILSVYLKTEFLSLQISESYIIEFISSMNLNLFIV